jgi:hypothetical protein
MTNALSTLVGPIIRNGSSWNLCVVGADDCVYGIPITMLATMLAKSSDSILSIIH